MDYTIGKGRINVGNWRIISFCFPKKSKLGSYFLIRGKNKGGDVSDRLLYFPFLFLFRV